MALDNLDANIPLQAGNIQIGNPQQLNAALAMQLRAMQLRQLQQNENALRSLYGNPQNLDETGRPTSNAIAQLMAASPQAGLELQNSLSQMDERNLRGQALRGQISEQHRKTGYEIGQEVLQTYEKTLKDTGDQKIANQRAMERRAELVEQARRDGSLPPQAAQNFMPWDPIKYRNAISGYQAAQAQPMTEAQRIAAGQKQTELGQKESEITETAQHHRAQEEQENWTMGTDQMTGRQFMYNKKTGATKPIDIPGGQAPNAAPASDLHGDDYLKTLDKGQAEQVKALAEGRMAFPSGFALRSPYWQRMLTQVSQYDPGFDAVNYQARYQTRKDFTSGQAARNITSFNTAIGHLGTLYDAAEKLGNSPFPRYNTIKNWVSNELGSARVKNFETARIAVVDELTRAFRGTGGNVHDIIEWTNTINSAGSPKQLEGAIEQAVDLLRSRIDSVGEQYNRGMGRTSDPLELLSSKARDTLAKLPGGGAAARPESGTPRKMPEKDASGIFAPTSEAEYNSLPSGAAFRKPDDPPGTVRIKP